MCFTKAYYSEVVLLCRRITRCVVAIGTNYQVRDLVLRIQWRTHPMINARRVSSSAPSSLANVAEACSCHCWLSVGRNFWQYMGTVTEVVPSMIFTGYLAQGSCFSMVCITICSLATVMVFKEQYFWVGICILYIRSMASFFLATLNQRTKYAPCISTPHCIVALSSLVRSAY